MIQLLFNGPAIPHTFSEINAEHLQELQRFAELGKLSATLLHDISSPLAAAIIHLEHDQGGANAPSLRRARRSMRTLQRYVEAARRQASHGNQPVKVFSARKELAEAVRLLRPMAARRRIKLKTVLPSDEHELFGDPLKFQQIIINLVTNAMDSYPPPKRIADHREVIIKMHASTSEIQLIVSDKGRGIAPEQLPLVFDSFYTTKRPSGTAGMGMGLAIVKRYVESDFGGTIMVESSPGKGSCFAVHVPVRASTHPQKAAGA